jgi:hypothetical protein
MAIAGLTACMKPEALLKPGGTFSVAERQSLAAIHPDLAHWQPSYTAVWRKGQMFRRVLLFRNDIASIVEHEDVLVFDAESRLVEATSLRFRLVMNHELSLVLRPCRFILSFRQVQLGVWRV